MTGSVPTTSSSFALCTPCTTPDIAPGVARARATARVPGEIEAEFENENQPIREPLCRQHRPPSLGAEHTREVRHDEQRHDETHRLPGEQRARVAEQRTMRAGAARDSRAW